jgi:hypothetical protein
MSKPIVPGQPRGIPALHRFLCAGWLTLYTAWVFIAPLLLTWRGREEEANWLGLWFIPTMGIGAVIGGLTVFWPKWYTMLLFALCSVVHLAFGLGCLPK